MCAADKMPVRVIKWRCMVAFCPQWWQKKPTSFEVKHVNWKWMMVLVTQASNKFIVGVMRVAGWREDGRLQAQCREIGQQGQQVQ